MLANNISALEGRVPLPHTALRLTHAEPPGWSAEMTCEASVSARSEALGHCYTALVPAWVPAAMQHQPVARSGASPASPLAGASARWLALDELLVDQDRARIAAVSTIYQGRLWSLLRRMQRELVGQRYGIKTARQVSFELCTDPQVVL